MKVIDTKILVEQVGEENQPVEKLGGLVIPGGSGEYDTVKVLSVGEKIENIKADDVLYVYPGSGKQITVEGKKYRVITPAEVIVVVD